MSNDSRNQLVVPTADRALERYYDAVQRTHRLIDQAPQRSTTRQETQARALQRQSRLRSLLSALGNPHHRYPIVHVAGTSGKGSTCTAIAAMLTAGGYRTGLHTSPYLQAATEKLQLDSILISAEDFASLVDRILEVGSTLPDFDGTSITYGETWVAMTLAWFARVGADIAVLETGAGGRFDLTNVVQPIASVITSIGLDHTETLGDTIAEISWHKAGIIKPGAPVITGVTDLEALPVIVREAQEQGVDLVQLADRGGEGEGIDVSFQQANVALAKVTVIELGSLGCNVSSAAMEAGLAKWRIPGRAEVVQRDPLVVLDGAHNPQKMQALTNALTDLLPVGHGRTRTAVFGTLESKNSREMLASLAPLVDRLIVTAPYVYGKASSNVHSLAADARELGIPGEITVIDDPLEAIEAAIDRAEPGDGVIVTGSMYLAGNVRERWYRTDDIVVQQTPWPVRHEKTRRDPGSR